MVVRSRMLQAKLDAPQMVEVPRGRKTVSIDVRAEITNVSDSDYVVHAPSRKHEHFWHLLDEKNREVARGTTGGAKGDDSGQFRGQTIAAGLSIHDSHRVQLPAQKLKDGKTYTLRSEFYGQMAEVDFVAVSPAKRAPGKGKKKAAKKAGAKKAAKAARTVAKKVEKKVAKKKAAKKAKKK